MKNTKTKILVAILSFIVGISAFYLSRSIDSFVASDISNLNTPNPSSRTTEIIAPVKELSGKVEIRFVRFLQGEHQLEAEIELTNNSAENVYYQSYSKDSYSFPTLKRKGKVVQDNRLRCGTGLMRQTLSSREVVLFRLPKSEVTYEPTKESWRETHKPTQIGFSFEVGDKPFVKMRNKQRETFWSEEIKFP